MPFTGARNVAALRAKKGRAESTEPKLQYERKKEGIDRGGETVKEGERGKCSQRGRQPKGGSWDKTRGTYFS